MSPTIKQKKAFKAMGENGGIISKAMETAGYSKTITHSTDKLVNSDGWKELMETYLPDSLLAKKHNQFLNSEREEIGLKALDLSYRVKSKIPKESLDLENVSNLNVYLVKINNVLDG